VKSFSREMRMSLRMVVCVAAALSCLVSGTAARAQAAAIAAPVQSASTAATGTKVHGTITDPDGELIPGATVTLTPAKGSAITGQSGADGTYTVTAAPGVYSVLVSMAGFAAYSASGVKIPAVASTTLDASLQIGNQAQVINVEANAVQLSVDPDANASSTVISGKDLEALSDDPDELSSELTALAGPSAGPNGGQIYVDGFTGGQLPPKSSIREIRINQNPFSAQYDKLGYGRIEVFTKPGTDKIHGSLQVNGNPSQFNAETPLETQNNVYVPPYHTVFAFGSLTGPVNKYASYSLGGSYRAIQDDAFTSAELYGVAGSVTPCPPGPPPVGGMTCTSPIQAQVSTNTPQSRFDFSPRIDLALGEKNVLTVRYQVVHNSQTNQGIGGLTLPISGYDNDTLNNELQISDTQTVSPKLINEIHFEYERDHTATTALNSTPGVSVSGSFNGGGSSGQNSSDHQDHIEAQNYTSLQLKKNFIRFGGRLRSTREAQNTQNGTNGSFTYTSLASYASGAPSQFSLTQVNVPKIDYTLTDLGLYAETDWKLRPNATISYGFRYETQNHLADHHDFAPRLAVSYGLFTGKGAPKTVLRGGFGMFYDRFGSGQVLTLLKENGVNESVFTVQDVAAGCSPNTFNPKSPTSVALCTGGSAASAATVYSGAAGLRTPYTTQVAIGADQQVGRFGTLSVNYIHSQGVHQIATQNIDYNAATMTSPGKNYQYFSGGVFNQNQLTLNGRVQTSKRVSLFGYYALGSAHGDTSGAGGFVTTPFNIAADYGRTSYDARSKYFIAGSISLPSFIQFSPFVIGQTGNPYNVTTGSDNNGDSVYNDRPYLVPKGTVMPVSPGTVSPVQTIAGCGTFAQPGFQTSGSKIVPINYCTGPALFTFNFRLTKTFGFGGSTKKEASQQGGGSQGGGPPGGGRGGGGSRGGGMGFGGGSNTGKRYNLGIGLQVQNLFNNENLATPIATLSSPEFGQSTQVTGGPYTSNSALRRISLQTSFTF
jgi:hypothetical protein